MKLIDFSIGEPNLPLHPLILKAQNELFCKAQYLPYPPVQGLKELRELVCEESPYKPHECLISPGAKFSLFACLHSLFKKEEEGIIFTPFWGCYPHMLKECGLKVQVTTSLKTLKINTNTRFIIINNPNNPSGEVLKQDELKFLLEIAIKHNLFLIFDEVYSNYVYGNTPFISGVSLYPKYDKIILIQSLSKNYSLAAWRIGFALAKEEFIQKMYSFQKFSATGAPTPSQKLAIEVLKNKNIIKKNHFEIMQERREEFAKNFYSIFGINLSLPQGGFYFWLPKHYFLYSKKMEEATHTKLLDGTFMGNPNYFRIALSVDSKISLEGLQRIKDYVNVHS